LLALVATGLPEILLRAFFPARKLSKTHNLTHTGIHINGKDIFRYTAIEDAKSICYDIDSLS